MMDLTRIFRTVLNALESMTSSGVRDELTYDQVIAYFVNDKPVDDRIAKGALLRESHRKGHALTQVFLDCDDAVLTSPEGRPYGRRVVARKLDAELEEIFGGRALIIFE